jgi:hypothetical protein
VPILIFAVLDAQYLRVERRFRSLFDQLREKDWSKLPTFEIGLKAALPSGYWDAFTSWSMRVNVVRNAWKISHPDNALMRRFYDSSLWESRKREGPESLKQLIREGVNNTSAICVAGWFRYVVTPLGSIRSRPRHYRRSRASCCSS